MKTLALVALLSGGIGFGASSYFQQGRPDVQQGLADAVYWNYSYIQSDVNQQEMKAYEDYMGTPTENDVERLQKLIRFRDRDWGEAQGSLMRMLRFAAEVRAAHYVTKMAKLHQSINSRIVGAEREAAPTRQAAALHPEFERMLKVVSHSVPKADSAAGRDMFEKLYGVTLTKPKRTNK